MSGDIFDLWYSGPGMIVELPSACLVRLIAQYLQILAIDGFLSFGSLISVWAYMWLMLESSLAEVMDGPFRRGEMELMELMECGRDLTGPS